MKRLKNLSENWEVKSIESTKNTLKSRVKLILNLSNF